MKECKNTQIVTVTVTVTVLLVVVTVGSFKFM